MCAAHRIAMKRSTVQRRWKRPLTWSMLPAIIYRHQFKVSRPLVAAKSLNTSYQLHLRECLLWLMYTVTVVAAAVAAVLITSVYENAARRTMASVTQSCSPSCRRPRCVWVAVCTRSTTPSRRNAFCATALCQTSTSASSAAAVSSSPSGGVPRSTSNTTMTPVAYWTPSANVSATAARTCSKHLDLGSATIKHLTFWLATSASIISTVRWRSTGLQNLRAGPLSFLHVN